MHPNDFWNRPCASPGLTSYRYAGYSGWIMIGAKSHKEALREAARSISTGDRVELSRLQVWNGKEYVNVS